MAHFAELDETNTVKQVIVVHDGSTAGGIPLARESQANTAISDFNPLVFLTSGM